MMKQLRNFVLLFLTAFITTTVIGQTGTIKGTITDDNGETLPGANVVVKGTTMGTITDLNGVYILNEVPVGEVTVVASFLGFLSEEKSTTVTNGQSSTVDILLIEDIMQLDEMVVVGYGSKRKRDLTSSIATVKADDLANVAVPSFESALQGKTSGVQVTTDNGLVGGGITIRVRGTSSVMSGSEPLYVIDGVPALSGSFTTNTNFPDKSNVLASINPEDIESIQVLKDASAAAIYGARGANGVVLVTTKQGKAGKTKFDVSYRTGVSDVTNKLDVLDGPEYLSLTQEAYLNSAADSGSAIFGNTIDDYWGTLPFGITKEMAEKTNTDWIDEMLQKGVNHYAALSSSGGNEKTTFYIGGSYTNQQGIILSNKYDRITSKITLDHKATNKLRFGANSNLSYSNNYRVSTGWSGGLGTAQSRSLPIMPIYDSTGNYFAPRSGTNMLAADENVDYVAKSFNMISNVFGEYEIIKGLVFRSEFGLNNLFQREPQYQSTITQEEAYAEDRRVQALTWNASNTLTYKKTLNDHDLSVMVGNAINTTKVYTILFWGRGFSNPSLHNPQNGAIQSGTDDEYAYGFKSLFSTLNYKFRNRYILSLSARRDGSSRFGDENRFGIFPAASLGWIVSDESFMNDVPYLTFLKLRASIGKSGNAEIGNYEYIGTYYTTQYNGTGGIGIDNVQNSKLHWEEQTQYDVGLDFGFLDGRISGGFDYYYKLSNDMLLNKNVPQTSGSSSVTQNVGSLYNKGIELFVTSRNMVGDFKWNTDFNIATNKNEVLDLDGQELSGLDAGGNYGNNMAIEGYPIGVWQLVDFYGVDKQTGEPLFVNQETGQPTTEYNFTRDAIFVGNPYPTLYGGITNSFEYKGFDLLVLFSFSYGNNVYRDDGKFFEGGNIGSNWNQMGLIKDRWQKPGDVTDMPKLIWESTYATYNTTQYLDDGSYIRLKTISFGYTLPKKYISKMKISNARIYVSGQNVLTFTKYKGWDPEVNRDNSASVTQSVTYLSPPQSKTYSVGINLSF